MTSFQSLFALLAPPAQATGLYGVYRAEFVGPAWLRQIAPPGLALGGLDGWWGKRFDGHVADDSPMGAPVCLAIPLA